MLGKKDTGIAQGDLPRPSVTYGGCGMEVMPTAGNVTLIIHTRDTDFGFPMNLDYAEGLARRLQDSIREIKGSGLTVVESDGILGPDGSPVSA